jgi:hypothetical protein
VADVAVLTVVAEVADVAEVPDVTLLAEVPEAVVAEVADVAEVAVVAEETPLEERSMLSVVWVEPMVTVWGSLRIAPKLTTTSTRAPLVRPLMV